jgi:hypothetical protein
MTILLRRKISYHLLQTYLPSGLFVIVAWLSLFLPPGKDQLNTCICNQEKVINRKITSIPERSVNELKVKRLPFMVITWKSSIIRISNFRQLRIDQLISNIRKLSKLIPATVLKYGLFKFSPYPCMIKF